MVLVLLGADVIRHEAKQACECIAETWQDNRPVGLQHGVPSPGFILLPLYGLRTHTAMSDTHDAAEISFGYGIDLEQAHH